MRDAEWREKMLGGVAVGAPEPPPSVQALDEAVFGGLAFEHHDALERRQLVADGEHLLHLLVKKVLVRDRSNVETWYRLPQGSPVRTLSDLVAPTGLEPVLPP